MTNRLAAEKSPYLLQHSENPVDWHPWGDEALDRARREDKPILVSIGYSACHWCHVMAHESFEDETIARMMNERFINIKVDREERPDVDAIYMDAVQALTGQGGWPLNIFLLPDGRPFYGGTYFPPVPGRGMPSWPQVLESVAGAYRERLDDVLKNAEVLTEYIARSQALSATDVPVSVDVLEDANQAASQQFDWRHGGFGSAPKFPQPLGLDFVLRMARRFDSVRAHEFVALTLHRMAEGGIYDQLGGGFHRYSVDDVWLVPHFEKMLYDNALLARVYLHAFQITGESFYRDITQQTLDYLLTEMRSPEGAFYSAEDADSEGVEGKYYVWTPAQMRSILGEEIARIAGLRYGVTAEGNFEGKSILTVARSTEDIARDMGIPIQRIDAALDVARRKLLQARSERVPPGKDTKILTSWNALAIRALAEAGRALGQEEYLVAARRAAEFLLSALRPEGQLLRSYRGGPSTIPAFLEDYAYLIEALLTLYETVYEPSYLRVAEDLTAEMLARFWDHDQGAFFDTRPDDDLVVRPRGFFDNPIPSGNSSATFALLRLASLTGNGDYVDRATVAFRVVRDILPRAPLGFAYLLSALDFYLSPQTQIAIVTGLGDDRAQGLAHAVHKTYLPNTVVAVGEPNTSPLLIGRDRVRGQATAYVCEHFACRMPVTTVEELEEQLAGT